MFQEQCFSIFCSCFLDLVCKLLVLSFDSFFSLPQALLN